MGNEVSKAKASLFKIYGLLVVLLILNIVVSKSLGLHVLAMVIPVVMAGFALAYFMHLNVEKKIVWGVMTAALIALCGFFFGSGSDIMMNSGTNWVKCNSYNDKNMARFAGQTQNGHESPYEGHESKLGLDASGAVCTPQRF